MKAVLAVLGGLALLGVIIAMAYIGGYDSRVKSAENGVARISEVQNQMKRQADMMPNAAEIVKGFAAHERGMMTDVIAKRQVVTNLNVDVSKLANDPAALQKLMDAQSSFAGAMSRFMAVAEKYPDVKAGEHFLALQSQWEGTQNRIAVARGNYINVARDHNASLKTWWASMVYSGKFQPLAEFKATAEEMKTPQFKF